MKKGENQNNPNQMNLFWFKSILSFWKNKFWIHSYMTSNMDDFKTICTYKNFLTSAYFSKNGRIFFISKNSTVSNIIPCAKHVLNNLKLGTLNAYWYLFRYIHFIWSCYVGKHPSLWEQFSWHQSPDEGY